jgi:hypothetical protein
MSDIPQQMPFIWWESKRLAYNGIVLMAAPFAALSGMVMKDRLPCGEGTLLVLLVRMVLFIFGLGLANICYFLGVITEWIIHPHQVDTFRRYLWWLGTGFSLLLLFLPTILLVIIAVSGTATTDCG